MKIQIYSPDAPWTSDYKIYDVSYPGLEPTPFLGRASEEQIFNLLGPAYNAFELQGKTIFKVTAKALFEHCDIIASQLRHY